MDKRDGQEGELPGLFGPVVPVADDAPALDRVLSERKGSRVRGSSEDRAMEYTPNAAKPSAMRCTSGTGSQPNSNSTTSARSHQTAGAAAVGSEVVGADVGAGGAGGTSGSRESSWNGVPPMT
jgi:hypothetical protein